MAGLGIQHIIVCGHSLCGAMKGLLHPESLTARFRPYGQDRSEDNGPPASFHGRQDAARQARAFDFDARQEFAGALLVADRQRMRPRSQRNAARTRLGRMGAVIVHDQRRTCRAVLERDPRPAESLEMLELHDRCRSVINGEHDVRPSRRIAAAKRGCG